MTRGPDKRFDREAVLDRAMAAFWAGGCEATGISELLKAMGIGRQSLYDTFGDKHALFLETLRHYFRTRIQPAMAGLRAPGSPMKNLRAVLRGLAKLESSQPGYGCFIGNSLAEFGQQDAEVNALILRFVGSLEDAFDDTLQQAREAGELGSTLPTRDLARMLVNTIQGMALLSKLERNPDRVRGVLTTALAMLEGK